MEQSDKYFKMYILRLFEEINFFHLEMSGNYNTKIGRNETFVYEEELITNPLSD